MHDHFAISFINYEKFGTYVSELFLILNFITIEYCETNMIVNMISRYILFTIVLITLYSQLQSAICN